LEAPREIDGARVLETAEIEGRATATGNTRHIVRGKAMDPASRLVIAQYAGEPGVYLFYCDRSWVVLNDTLHDSITKAKEQAEFEYAGSSALWRANAV
jgi:hypothetical protein